MPVIFTRVLKMFSLPVYYSKINVGHKGVSLDSSTAAKWIIYTLGIFTTVNLYFTHIKATIFFFRRLKSNTEISDTVSAVNRVLLPPR